MNEPSTGNNTLKWMVDEFLNFHDTKNIKEEAGSKVENYCKLSREEVHNIRGTFYSSGGLTWTFVLEDATYRIPCILKNSASNIDRLINLLETSVVVRKGHLVAEKYTVKDGHEPTVWLQVSVDDIFILDVDRPCNMPPLDESHWNQRLLVVHASTPIINADRSSAYSFVLVMTKLPGSEQSQYLWIMLTGKQLQWNLYLIPNREYDIHMTCDQNYFKEETRHLRAVAGSEGAVKDIAEILHHETMWPTMDCVKLPADIQISLQSSSIDRQTYNCKWPPVWWMSIDEALAQNDSQLTFSIWGEVVRVFDDNQVKEVKSTSCTLCQLKHNSKCRMRGESPRSRNRDFKMADAGTVYNPWETGLHMNEPLRIPAAHDSDKPCLKLPTLPGGLTKNVTLKDTQSGKEVCMYVKQWGQHQYVPVFTPGVILCARLVQKRVSRNGNCYFTTCALSSFEVIGCGTSMSNIGGSYLKYGFPYKLFKPQEKVWGILDTWKLVKASLSHSSINNYNYPEQHHFRASATLLVERHSGDPILVSMKDNNVRVLLDIPLQVWTDLIEYSRDAPIEYNPSLNRMEVGIQLP